MTRCLRALAATLLATHAAAAPLTVSITCPAYFPTEAVTLTSAETGWAPFMPAPLEVRTGELMYGPPSSYTLATPTRERRLAGRTRLHGRWLRCDSIELTSVLET